ncbi:MAG: DUF2182 domain-containing protein [Chloroflexi bacterium]|nr:DUF2182 domain-containing protein [Chloroflexota bacterium]
MLTDGHAASEGYPGPGLTRDRGTLLTGGVLIAVAALAWLAVILHTAQMPGMSPAGMPGMSMGESDMGMTATTDSGPASLTGAAAYLVAWGLMMAAMMLPSATPMIALYGAVHRQSARTGRRGVSTALFALVYLAVWTAFGIPVYAASVLVDVAAGASPAVAGLLPYGVALVLLMAGAYQLSPLKEVCLRVCQSPLGFLLGRWRGGYRGTLEMALRHAAYCVGCCWALMIVLVAAGAMGLHWVLLIAAVVFAEKLLPRGAWMARIVGGVLLGLGLLVAAQPDLVGALRGQMA